MEKHRLDKTPEERKDYLLSIGKETTWPAAGRIFCKNQYLWCASVDPITGRCTADRCSILSPEYIANQKKVEIKQQEAHKMLMEKQKVQFPESRPIIRTQNKTQEELISRRIEHLQDLITLHYKYARPHKAAQLELEIKRLEHEKRLLEQPLIKTNYR